MVYPLVHFLLIIQHDKGLGGDGVAVEDETEVTPLTLHVREVYQGGVQSKNTGGRFLWEDMRTTEPERMTAKRANTGPKTVK